MRKGSFPHYAPLFLLGAGVLCIAFLPDTQSKAARPTTRTPVDALLTRIKAVGREGAGNAQAARAWKQLVQRGPEVLPTILAAIEQNNATTSNWLRTAVDTIAERSLAEGTPLPVTRLEKFIANKSAHAPAARRIAYEWLAKVDRTAPERLLPTMLHDPSVELRRGAVALMMARAQKQLAADDKKAAKETFQKALAGAVDDDQVKLLSKQLGDLGVKVNMADHMGFIRSWYVLAPFDNHKGVGYAKVYPPEKGVDLKAQYDGKANVKARWMKTSTDHNFGLVDLNKVYEKVLEDKKGVVGYAYSVIVSPREQPVEIRVSSITAVKIFLNGKLLLGREEYHHGMRFDQHIARGTLKKGRNEILLKVCQNEQKQDWAQKWRFQARLCDAVGEAVPFQLAPMMKPNQSTPKGESQ